MAILTALWGLSKARPVSHESRGQKIVVTWGREEKPKADSPLDYGVSSCSRWKFMVAQFLTFPS